MGPSGACSPMPLCLQLGRCLGRQRVHGRLSEAISGISTSSGATGEEGREENWAWETMGRMLIRRNFTRFGPRVLLCYVSSVTAQLTWRGREEFRKLLFGMFWMHWLRLPHWERWTDQDLRGLSQPNCKAWWILHSSLNTAWAACLCSLFHQGLKQILAIPGVRGFCRSCSPSWLIWTLSVWYVWFTNIKASPILRRWSEQMTPKCPFQLK